MSDPDLVRRERALGIVWSMEFEVTPWSGPFEWTDGTEFPERSDWNPQTDRASLMLVRGQANARQVITSLSQDTRDGEGLRRLLIGRCVRWSEVAARIARPVADAGVARIPSIYGRHPAVASIVVPGILYGVGERWLCVYTVGERWLIVSMAGRALPDSPCGRCSACASMMFRGRQRAFA